MSFVENILMNPFNNNSPKGRQKMEKQLKFKKHELQNARMELKNQGNLQNQESLQKISDSK